MLSTTVLAALLALPPTLPFPGWAETQAARSARLGAVAADIATAAHDACGDRGEGCDRHAAAILVGIGTHESNWAADVESPDGCYRGPGQESRCDGGRAFGYWQAQGSAEERAAWAADRVLAARVALRRAFRSLNACRSLPVEERWAVYAGGRCDSPEALRRSRELHAAILRASRAMARDE